MPSIMYTYQNLVDSQTDAPVLKSMNIDVVMNYYADDACMIVSNPDREEWEDPILVFDVNALITFFSDLLAIYEANRLKGLLRLGPITQKVSPDLQVLQQVVTALKDHPALFGWYAYDEPTTAFPVPSCENVYDTIKAIDSNHPVVMVYPGAGVNFWGSVGVAYPFPSTRSMFDVFGLDNYPVNGAIYDATVYQSNLEGAYSSIPVSARSSLINLIQVFTEGGSGQAYPSYSQIQSIHSIGSSIGLNTAGVAFWIWAWSGREAAVTTLRDNTAAHSTVAAIALQYHEDLYPPQLYLQFTVQPSVQSLSSGGGVIAYSTNELMLADGSQLQMNQSEASSSQLAFIASLSESQSNQTSLANALELFQSTVAQGQSKNTEVISSSLIFSGSTSEAQNKNTEASSASLNFAGSVGESQLTQQESSSLALFFSGTIAELQALQAEAITGTITSQGVFVGSVNQLQTLQAESVLSAESFEAFISEVQLSQSEAVAVIQAFQGAAQSQKVQEEAGTGQLLFVGIVSQSQRLQSEFALDFTPVIVKNASTVYASQIESAKRQIKAKGASVVWRSPQIIADEVKPWKVAGFANIDHTVSIVFDIVTGSNKSSRYLKDTNIEVGTEIGYMASVDFEPNLGDVVIRNDKELSVKNINTIQPDGNPILHIIEFAK